MVINSFYAEFFFLVSSEYWNVKAHVYMSVTYSIAQLNVT
jgi:hypothetical protein